MLTVPVLAADNVFGGAAAVYSLSLPQSRLLRLALPAIDGVGLLTGVFYLLFFGFAYTSFTDPDYWWHMRTGQVIVENLSIPQHDTYSFTAAGEGLLNHQWLSEALLYLAVTKLGYAVTLGFFITMVLGAFAIMHRLLLRLGTPRTAAVGLIGLGMLTSLLYVTVRPQLVSWFLLAVFINCLLGRGKPVWPLVAVMLVWSNLHLGYVLGLGIVMLWFASRVWDRLAGDRAVDLRGAALFVAACFAATALNPNGMSSLAALLSYVPFTGSDVNLQGITELQSPDFSEPIHVPLLIGIVVLVALSLVGQLRDRFALLLAVVFVALALQASRFQPIFALAYLPAAGLAARALVFRASDERPAPRTAVNWGLLALATIAVLVVIPSLPHPQVHREPITDGRVYYPAAALAWLQENRPDANVFARHEWGGYFIYGLRPAGHVYIDGRTDLYGSTIFDDYQDILSANFGWQELLEESAADTVVVDRTARLATALQTANGWSLTVEGPQEVVYIR